MAKRHPSVVLKLVGGDKGFRVVTAFGDWFQAWSLVDRVRPGVGTCAVFWRDRSHASFPLPAAFARAAGVVGAGAGATVADARHVDD